MDKFKEECGLFGIFNHPEAANLTYLGLHALQHRGQEGAGIVSSDEIRLYTEKGIGLVSDIFSKEKIDNQRFSNMFYLCYFTCSIHMPLNKMTRKTLTILN